MKICCARAYQPPRKVQAKAALCGKVAVQLRSALPRKALFQKEGGAFGYFFG
jgi:hypothetical protein